MKTLRVMLMCGTIGLMAGAAVAAPNFSGTWTFNPAKGQNLGMVAAVQETIVIAQTPEKVTIDYASTFQGETNKRQANFDLSGKPVMNPGAMGGESETVAQWSGDKLVTTWTSEGAIAGSTVTRTETWSLSGDGQAISVESVRGTSPPRIMVYEKKK
jgi:hypothetical protein